MTEEPKIKIRMTQKGKHNSPNTEFKLGHSVSADTRKKLSKAKKGKPSWNKGFKMSEEAIENNRKSHLGQKSWNKGNKGLYKCSEETKKKISKANSGENAYQWKGGISKKKGYNAIYGKRHRARKRNAEGSHTFGEWENLKKQYGFTCPCCQKSEPEITLTEDHIIPLSKGGSDFIENIQPLCQRCNSKKHTKIITYPVKVW